MDSTTIVKFFFKTMIKELLDYMINVLIKILKLNIKTNKNATRQTAKELGLRNIFDILSHQKLKLINLIKAAAIEGKSKQHSQ